MRSKVSNSELCIGDLIELGGYWWGETTGIIVSTDTKGVFFFDMKLAAVRLLPGGPYQTTLLFRPNNL